MINFIELTYLLIRRDMVVRYRGTLLGYVWSILNPLTFALVYFFAFKYIIRIQVDNYAVFLLTGLFPWIWISSAFNNGTAGFVSFQGILKSGYVKPVVVPFLVVVIEFANFVQSLPVLLFLIFVTGTDINISITYLLAVTILTFVFLISMTYIISAVSLVFRDTTYLVQLVSQMMFFLTPIIYPLSFVPENFIYVYKLNPIVNIIELWRQALYLGNIQLSLFIYPLIFSLILILISYFFTNKISSKAMQWL
jgi:lipopolysaccharide transport system permease protein